MQDFYVFIFSNLKLFIKKFVNSFEYGFIFNFLACRCIKIKFLKDHSRIKMGKKYNRKCVYYKVIATIMSKNKRGQNFFIFTLRARSPGLNFGVFEYHTPKKIFIWSIQNKTSDDIGKFMYVSGSFILDTSHKMFSRIAVYRYSKILTR